MDVLYIETKWKSPLPPPYFHTPPRHTRTQLWCFSYHLLSERQDNLRANDKLWQMTCLQAPARRWNWQTPSPFLFLQALGCAKQAQVIYCRTWLGVSHAPSVSSRLWGSPSIIVSHLSLSLLLSVSHTLSVLWALSLYSFTQRSLFHSSIHNASSLSYRSSLQISIMLYRWLVIWPGVIMNLSQGPDQQLLSPSVSPSPQTWSKMSNSSKFPDIWFFLANIDLLLSLKNSNAYAFFKQTKTDRHLRYDYTNCMYVCPLTQTFYMPLGKTVICFLSF